VELSKSFRDPAALLETLGLSSEQPSASASSFSFLVPRGYAARMEKGNPQDPLLKQVLPVAEEEVPLSSYTHDPLNERGAERTPGILQKYAGRALLIATPACAIHCRYCFRRHFPYRPFTERHLDAAFAYIRREDSIREVILSGGDPLCLTDEKLVALINQLATIPHVQQLRIHTRLPVVLPERVDDNLLAWLTETPLPTVIIIHANHPHEIDETVIKALAGFRTAGIFLLNQSVLLRGINDDGDTLIALSERLFTAGVLPYYLHMLDPVVGVGHFAVEERRAKEIMAEMRSLLPGYLVPRLVREIAGAGYKIPLF